MLQILWILVALAAIGLAVAFAGWIPYIVGGAFAAAFALWILISTLSPAVPDRKCPRCGGEGLVKIKKGDLGVRCELCGFQDSMMHVAYLDEW